MIKNTIPIIPVPQHIMLIEQKLNCHAVFVNESYMVGNLKAGQGDSGGFGPDAFYRFGNLNVCAWGSVTIPDAANYSILVQICMWNLNLSNYQATKILTGKTGIPRISAEWQFNDILFNNLDIETAAIISTGMTFENLIGMSQFTGYKFLPN